MFDDFRVSFSISICLSLWGVGIINSSLLDNVPKTIGIDSLEIGISSFFDWTGWLLDE